MQVSAPIRPTKASGNLVQLVTDATNGQDISRIFRIGLELLTKSIDVRIDVALVAFVVRAPNAIEQRVSGPCSSRFRCEQLENLKLKRCQVDAKTLSHHFMTTLIDYEIANLDAFSVRFLRRRSAAS